MMIMIIIRAPPPQLPRPGSRAPPRDPASPAPRVARKPIWNEKLLLLLLLLLLLPIIIIIIMKLLIQLLLLLLIIIITIKQLLPLLLIIIIIMGIRLRRGALGSPGDPLFAPRRPLPVLQLLGGPLLGDLFSDLKTTGC